MEIDLGPEAEKFRAEFRDWLEANRPASLEGYDDPNANPDTPELLDWAEKLRDGGYLCVTWPKEFGGRGLSAAEVAVMNEELNAAGLPRVTRGMGENLVGPAIIAHGTDEQRERFLPRIISGEDRYCQGFSEPDSGSDLASLKTRGIIDGDELVITGQKVWTSWYWRANMLFCLCRTDSEAPKHQGISYVLIPLEKEDGSDNGIEFRPLRQITGESHFAETFVEEARAPLSNVIGGLNNGWRVAMTTLGSERGGTATTQHVQFRKEFWRLVEVARERGKLEDPIVRQRLAWAYSRVEVMRYQGLRLLSALLADQNPGPGGSINKMYWSEYYRRFAEYAVEILGPEAMVVGDDYELDYFQRIFLQTRGHTIWGGTAEIQRNIVGERLLGLPKEPRPA